MSHKRSLLGGCLSVLSNKFLGNKKGFSITEVLIALGVIAVIAVLILPVITTRAQNKSFALSYETEVKQMLNSLEGLPVSENKEDITNTMMYVESDTGSYANNAGAYINKYMKVVKYCGDEPGDCFGGQYYEYKDNDRVEFDIKDIKGACALLKNGVSICLKPQIKNASDEEIQGWIDLNGPKGPNIYGRDLRTFAINLKQKAVFTEEEPTRVIVPDPPERCEGPGCDPCEIDPSRPGCDPCKGKPRSEECCKREGFVASGKDDICCPWYRDASTGPNHIICYPGPAPCPPDDPNCHPDECSNHAITGPGDECCAIIEAQGKHDPNCCAPNDVSDYCCSVHPETEGCCRKNIQSGKLKLTADSNCCTKYPAIYAEFSACKPACEQNNNSEQCCNTVSRRNEIREPDDACCMYEAVNGLDALGANNAYNKYCCRLPKNNSDQCCKWKYEHINSNLDYYTKHDYNVNGGTFDGCCHGNIRGIKYTENKTDVKSKEVLKRCCTVNQAQSDKKEDELCCDYLVSQLGDVKLQHGQALRRCCQYDSHKNKPQCCSHDRDGLASHTYPASPVVNWAAQCCMPNSIYNNNVDPHIQCCFVNPPQIVGESNLFWNNKRWEGCCSYGDINYNGHKANTEGQWQKNCCKLSRSKYPSDATYNAACCLANAPSKAANRDSWQYFSATKNECCETLDRQYTSGSQHRDDNWQSHCCYGFKGGNLATNNPYYETESKCCKITGNWTEGCCTKSGLDTNDEKWKKNCCSLPTQYSSNVEYRKYCCYDSNTSNSKANSTDKDYTRNSDNADNPNSKNAANVNNSNNRQYCCDPDIADHPSITDNGNKFTWGSTNTPKKECCDYFAGRDWKNNDGGSSLSKYYKAACCQAYGHKDGLNCEELWMCGARYGYGVTPSKLSAEIANGCCINWSLIKANEDIPTSAWKNGCCDNPAYYQSNVSGKNAAYRQFCCIGASSDRQRKGEGNLSANTEYCCFPDSTNPNPECCKLFRSKGNSNVWKDWDGNTLSNDYMTYCCNKSTAAGQNTANNYCPDSCAIRWNTAESTANINYDFSRCCTDRALATNKSPVNSSTAVNRTKAIWKNNCCAYSPVNPAGNNIAGYASYTDYRSGCCNASQDQTFKSGNGGSSQNNINCCIPNQVSVNTSTGAVSGIVPTKACCEAFKAYDTGKTGAWKSHDGETINDAYKTACCKLHGVCPDGEDACRIRSNTWNTSMYNLPTCCKDSTMQSQHYKDNDQVWRKACCDGNTSGTSTLNTLGDADYRNYCCSSAGSSDATLKSGTQDRRCCKNAGNTTRLRNQYCCSHDVSSRSDLTNIGYHCDCTTAANTWQVVNTAYQTTCCTDSNVMTSATSSITNNTTTRADWQSKCCTQSIVHTSPANNTIRDRHYSYCCNNGGAYSDKSKWLNSTCCKVDSSSSSSKSTEGVDWSGVTTVSACCYYLESYPTETCCSAKQSSAGWNNTTSTRDTGYKKSCCDQVNNDKYCSCGSKLDKNMSTSDACCNAMKSSDNTKARWQADCCKYRTSYPSNAAYRSSTAGCCSGDGVNATKNPASQNDVKYCCDPNASKPTAACCLAYKANGWKNWDGPSISEAYRIYCCQTYGSASDQYCDSCDLRSKTNNSNGQWNLPACCTNATMKSEHNASATWKQACCDYPSYYTDFTAYKDSVSGCCSLSTDRTRTGTGNKSNNLEYCCLTNSVTSFTLTNSGDSYSIGGVKPSKDCCTLFKGKGWKDHDGTSMNRLYKLACCTYGSDLCPLTDLTCQEKWALGGSYRSGSFPSCCQTMSGKVSYDDWRQPCCAGASKGATDGTPNWSVSATNYKSYCCAPNSNNDTGKIYNSSSYNYAICCDKFTAGTSYCCKSATGADSSNWSTNGYKWNGSAQDSCCLWSGSPSKHCCSIAYAKRDTTTLVWPSPYSSMQQACCDKDNTYCSCAQRLAKSLSLSATCCAVTNASYTNSHWKSQCCAGSNPGGLTRDQFRASCCTNGKNGSATGGGTTTYCCTGSTSDRLSDNDNYCCKFYSNNQCTCAYRLANSMAMRNPVECCAETKSSYTNSHWKSQCCAGSNPGGITRDEFRASCCTNGKNGSATGGGTSTHCCTGSTSDRLSDNDNYCCKFYSNNQCTCAYRLANSMAMRSPVECCAETKSSYTNSHWKSQCCSYTNPGGLTRDEFRTSCCTNGKNGSATGGGTSTHCCTGSTSDRLSDNDNYCCKFYSNNQCTCAYRLANSMAMRSPVECCAETKSSYTNSHWKSQCCASTNPGGITQSQFQSVCCKNWLGEASGGGNTTWCCDNNSSHISDWCCDQGYTNQCSCSKRKDKGLELNVSVTGEGNCCDTYAKTSGWYNNSNFKSKCCAKFISSQSSYTSWSSYCCADGAGSVVGTSTKNETCCSNSTSTISDWCCDKGYTNQCSCSKRKDKGLELNVSVTGEGNCCDTYAKTSGWYNNSNFKSKCCAKYMNNRSAYQSWSANCCAYGDGHVIGTSTLSEACCDGSVITDWCCDKGYTNQCSCTKRRDNGYDLNVSVSGEGNCCDKYAKTYGWYNNSNFQSRCCSKYLSSPSSYYNWAGYCCSTTKNSYSGYTDWKNNCCPSPSSNYSGYTSNSSGTGTYQSNCCTDWSGHYYGGGSSQSSTCCKYGQKTDYCCQQKRTSGYCTCSNQVTYMGLSSIKQSDCCSSLYSSYKSNSTYKGRCCSSGYLSSDQWQGACCSSDYINSGSDTDKKKCCASLYNTSGEGNLFAGAGSTCCQALGTGDDGYSSYNGKTYAKCKAICYRDIGETNSPYSTSTQYSYKYSKDSAAYCCHNNYGVVSSSSKWKSYCCKTYYGSSWNFSPSDYGCCDYIKSNGVYWYNPSYYGGSCSFGGEAYKCSDYYYSSKGFVCGSSDSCKAWRFQGGSMPSGCGSSGASGCCTNLYNWGYLDGDYKTKCCNNGTFRKSTTGQSVCCGSEPSDSSLKENCCKDNSSRSYCDKCEMWKNGKYTYTGSQSVTGPKACCDNWGASTVGANSTLKSKCCANAAWAPNNPGTCCDISSVQSSYLGACCNYWRDNSQTSHKSTCCGNDGWKKANNTEGKWCYEPPACTVPQGVHIELTCKRDSANSANITCTASTTNSSHPFTFAAVVNGTVTSSWGFGIPTGNSSNSVSSSNVKKFTGLTVSYGGGSNATGNWAPPSSGHGFSPSFLSNNEYNVGLTTNSNCTFKKDFENMCAKMIGPDKCPSSSNENSMSLSIGSTSSGGGVYSSTVSTGKTNACSEFADSNYKTVIKYYCTSPGNNSTNCTSGVCTYTYTGTSGTSLRCNNSSFKIYYAAITNSSGTVLTSAGTSSYSSYVSDIGGRTLKYVIKTCN